MERLGWSSPSSSPPEMVSLGYVSWKEVNVSSDKGRREVHYYLKRMDGGLDLAVIGKEKSLRHMSYHYAIRNRSVLLSTALSLKLKSRREVIDWLNFVVSDSLPQGSPHLAGSPDDIDVSEVDIETFKDIQLRKLGHYTTEFLWLGSPWTCRKRRKHYQSFRRNGVKISVNDFVYVLAEEDKRLVAYLEDMYEDSKGCKMVVVRWFHKIDEVGIVLPHNFNDREIFFSLCLQDLSIECIDGLATVLSPQHFEKFLNEAMHTRLDPFVCCKQFDNDDVKPFDITEVKGYWKQEILRYMYSVSTSKDQAKSQQPVDENDATGVRPRKRHRQSEDNDVFTGSKGSMDTACVDLQNLHNSGIDCKSGTEISSLKGECAAPLSTTEAKQNLHLKVGSEVEVFSQDSGIRGCWFRASIIKKHKDKVKVRYQDIKDAADEANKLEEWILASRIAASDQLGIRICGRAIIRPSPQFIKGQLSCVVDVGTSVDVWWHDAWWEGIVVQKESEDRIHVYFPGEKQESVFGHADLRLSQEWLGNRWTCVKERPDILSCVPSRLETKEFAVKSDENELTRAAICDSRQSGKIESGCGDTSLNDKGKELEVVPDLSKDDLLTQLRWKSSKKRRRGGGISGHKKHHNNNSGKRSMEVIASNTYERFLIPTALKVDHENCKYRGNSLFTSTVVQPLTNLVMSR